MPSQMKQFLDIQGGLWASGKTVNKVVSAMSSAQNPHGGQDGKMIGDTQAAVKHQSKRTVQVAEWVKKANQ